MIYEYFYIVKFLAGAGLSAAASLQSRAFAKSIGGRYRYKRGLPAGVSSLDEAVGAALRSFKMASSAGPYGLQKLPAGDFEHLHDADGSAQYCTHRLNASGFSPQSRSARGDDGKAILDLKVGSNSSRFGANDAERRLSRLR